MLASDLKWCDLWDNWRKIAQNKGAWRCLVGEITSNFNDHNEACEKESKDQRKRRKQEGTETAALDWKWKNLGIFCVAGKAGLLNHVRERHGCMFMVMERCAFHDKTFQTQRTTAHRRSCQANTNRMMSWSR